MKKRILILMGGQSGEHEVSLMSAISVLKAINYSNYDVIPIGISKNGTWKFFKEDAKAIAEWTWQEAKSYLENEEGEHVSVRTSTKEEPEGKLVVWNGHRREEVELVFPVLHGPKGEDGTIQGMCEMLNIPYVGAGVLASSLGMDKGMTKKIVESMGISQAKYHLVTKQQWESEKEEIVRGAEKAFSYPVFVKPCNLGSSVGVTKAKDQATLIKGIDEALRHDGRILVERFVNAREVECGVLGNETPRASVPAEIIPHNEFYDYQDKYFDGKSRFEIPPKMSVNTIKTIKKISLDVYKALGVTGLARVDFFVEKDTGEIFFNEINTMPGFTKISMYPKMWEVTGISYDQLIDELIQLGFSRHQKRERKIK